MRRTEAIKIAIDRFEKIYPTRRVRSLYVTEHKLYFDILFVGIDSNCNNFENSYVVYKEQKRVDEYDKG